MTPPRDVRELVGDDVPDGELERLRRVHELLVQAGPPPELSPALASPPGEPRTGALAFLPQRRRGALIVLAAALAALAFGIGYLAGGRGDRFAATFRPPSMIGTPAEPHAFASLAVGTRDAGGNWPILMKVHGLEPLPAGRYYVLYVSRGRRPLAPCGSFRVHGGVTTVHMSSAYDRDALKWDAWVVTVEREGQRAPGRVVMVTPGKTI